jgi:hypothetical protein
LTMNWTTACTDWESRMSAAMKGRKKTDEHTPFNAKKPI